MWRWFKALSIRWKLQLGFFAVTMVTTIYNRWLASLELGKMIDIAESNHVSASIVQQLVDNRNTYIFNSVWESGLEFVFQFFIIGIVASAFVKPIQNLCAALKSIEAGDLTHSVPHTSSDEIGTLEESFNNVREKLDSIMGKIDESGKSMSQSAYQIATISQEIASVSKREQQRSDDVTQATSQLYEVSDSVQKMATNATERAKHTEQRAKEGIDNIENNILLMKNTSQEVDKAASQITELNAATEQIHNIIGTISSIAEQTNMLSLNAAIEAARAGDAGRGFAVVADEVRTLAHNTTSSLSEIESIISTVTDNISLVTNSMEIVVEKVGENQEKAKETSDIIKTMAENATENANANQKIYDVSDSQLRQLKSLDSTLQDLFETLLESSSKVETTSAIGHDLFKVTEKLNSVLAGFSFEYKGEIEPAQHEKRVYPRSETSLLVKIKGDNGHEMEGITSDFSMSGLKLRVSKKLSDGPVLMDIYLPYDEVEQYESQVPLHVTGTIMRENVTENRYTYGIQFTDLQPAQTKGLKYCFEYFKTNSEYGEPLSQTITA